MSHMTDQSQLKLLVPLTLYVTNAHADRGSCIFWLGIASWLISDISRDPFSAAQIRPRILLNAGLLWGEKKFGGDRTNGLTDRPP